MCGSARASTVPGGAARTRPASRPLHTASGRGDIPPRRDVGERTTIMPGRRPTPEDRRRVAPMKWWGWGHEDVSFTHADKPGFAPFIARHLEIDVERSRADPVAFA